MKKLLFPALIATAVGFTSCQSGSKNEQRAVDSIAVAAGDTTALADAKLPDATAFSSTLNGQKTGLYVLKNKTMQVAITNYGARIVSLLLPDKTGKLTDVAIGFGTVKAYQTAAEPFVGPIVGRFGNRIAKGQFMLDGQTYQTELNNNGNTLHSGPSGFHTHAWTVKRATDKELALTYVSKDGEGGFPGTVTTDVTFSLTDTNGLTIDYTAKTSKPTPYNPTSHGFFNLNGEGHGTILDHVLMIDADKYSVVDKGLIPQGDPVSVEKTPFDFRKPTAIGARINDKNEQLGFGGGYDHNFVLNKKGGGLEKAVTITGDKSGITMDVLTTEPAMQFYSGNFFKGADTGKYGRPIGYREAFALEAQHYPDSPNHPTYPNTILRPGQTYHQTTEYRFSTGK